MTNTYLLTYDYTVQVRNRFKGLDLIDRVPEEVWTEVCNIVQEVVIKTIPPKKDILFIIGDRNAKTGSQEISGVTGKLGLGVQNEAGQRLTVLPRERTGHSKHPLPTIQEKTLCLQCWRAGLIPGLGRSPGERNGYLLQYSSLENSMDYIVHGGHKEPQRFLF